MTDLPYIDLTSNVRSDGVTTTEFHDQIVKRGIIEDDTPLPPESNIDPSVEYFKPMGDKDTKSRQEMEDDEDDERRFLERYREQRKQQLKEEKARFKFGRLFMITEPDYVGEVSEASVTDDVVVLLTCDGNRDCEKLETIFNQMAPIHGHIKFVRIKAQHAIHDYPDQNCPTVLVYRNKTIIKTWVTAAPFGGRVMSKKTVELELMKIGVLTSADLLGVDDDEDVEMDIHQKKGGGMSVSLTAKKGKGYSENYDSNSDDESDSDSRTRRNHTGGRADFGRQGSGWNEVRFDFK
ncbi:putative phosducin family protein [Blattamonas nauphoetae]|uniref:Phosducin family protein n=1 Tax=Blattamonas nauphoetae TaxID=2049346 RepID=A0ABQ9XVV6_9EUKA|nr:putative phosducin family protein [Blattamonas nauphoetae]